MQEKIQISHVLYVFRKKKKNWQHLQVIIIDVGNPNIGTKMLTKNVDKGVATQNFKKSIQLENC